jgi:AraC family transcriptional regulator
MTDALRLYQGSFGRAALLDSDHDLATHAHPQCHVLIKAGGADTEYRVRGRAVPLTHDAMVLVNAWEPHSKVHSPVLAVRSFWCSASSRTGWRLTIGR